MSLFGRRAFLRMIPGMGLAGKAAAEQAAAKLAGVDIGGVSAGPASYGAPIATNSEFSVSARAQALRVALKQPRLAAEFRSLLYDNNRTVNFIDYDLAIKRSFSLSAKIVFQRQRNVERELQCSWLEDSPYIRMVRFGRKLAGAFVPGGL